MIKNVQNKKIEIIDVINERIHIMDEIYRTGKSFDRYKIVLNNRKNENSVKSYLTNDNYLLDIYKTLEAWDMNKRGAKLRKLSEIKQSFIKNMDYFIELEKIGLNIIGLNIEKIEPVIKKLYNELYIMESNSKLVSFSKTLHFIFPSLFMPMDRQNTLRYFYNNQTSESYNKFLDIYKFCHNICNENINWNKILNSGWNSTVPKIVDNAIILKMLDFA